MIDILVIGDTHIPKRAMGLSPLLINELNTLSAKKLFEFVIFTGDVVKSPETIRFFKNLAKKKFLIVQGNMDYYYGNIEAPLYDSLSITLKNDTYLNIGITHGAEIHPRGDKEELINIAKENNVNLLIFAHTHLAEILLSSDGILLLNPGSFTGAWSFVASRTPSFIIIKVDIEESEIKVILYELKNDRIVKTIESFYFKNQQFLKS